MISSLREIILEIFGAEYLDKIKSKEFRKGDIVVVNVLKFRDETGFLLASYNKNVSTTKCRPLIIVDVRDSLVTLAGFSTFFYHANIHKFEKRRIIRIEDLGCALSNSRERCFGLDLRTKRIYLFNKETKTKKLRVFFNVDITTLEHLRKDGYLAMCGNCEEGVSRILKKIKNRGDIL
ncbi:hypothetical protein [Hydrogenobaculum acidophilum]